MKRILVPTDFSDTANNALQFAADLAKKNNAEIVLLHVYHVPVIDVYTSATYIEEMQKEQEKESLQKLDAIVTELTKGGIIADSISKPGFLADEIELIEEKEEVDFIVMGTTGASGALASLIGSNAARAIEKSTVPIMVVPHEARNKQYKKIGYAYDFVDVDVTSLGSLADFAQPYSADVLVMHVKDEAHFRFKDEEKILADAGKKYGNVNFSFAEIKDTDIADALNECIEEEDLDLLVMTHHHRTFFEKLFHKSLTKKMAYHTNIPLLVYHG